MSYQENLAQLNGKNCYVEMGETVKVGKILVNNETFTVGAKEDLFLKTSVTFVREV